MNIEIRIYKRYDTDLLSLHDAGYSVTKMMAEAVSAYANGLPFRLFIDELVSFDMNDKKSIRLRLKFKDNDTKVATLIRNVKHGYRSNFCKQILRNAMIHQNLICYFSDTSLLSIHEANIRTVNLQAFPLIKKCSDYRRTTQQLNILGRDITIQHEKGYSVPTSIPTQNAPVYVLPQGMAAPSFSPNQIPVMHHQPIQAYYSGHQGQPVYSADTPYVAPTSSMMNNTVYQHPMPQNPSTPEIQPHKTHTPPSPQGVMTNHVVPESPVLPSTPPSTNDTSLENTSVDRAKKDSLMAMFDGL